MSINQPATNLLRYHHPIDKKIANKPKAKQTSILYFFKVKVRKNELCMLISYFLPASPSLPPSLELAIESISSKKIVVGA